MDKQGRCFSKKLKTRTWFLRGHSENTNVLEDGACSKLSPHLHANSLVNRVCHASLFSTYVYTHHTFTRREPMGADAQPINAGTHTRTDSKGDTANSSRPRTQVPIPPHANSSHLRVITSEDKSLTELFLPERRGNNSSPCLLSTGVPGGRSCVRGRVGHAGQLQTHPASTFQSPNAVSMKPKSRSNEKVKFVVRHSGSARAPRQEDSGPAAGTRRGQRPATPPHPSTGLGPPPDLTQRAPPGTVFSQGSGRTAHTSLLSTHPGDVHVAGPPARAHT